MNKRWPPACALMVILSGCVSGNVFTSNVSTESIPNDAFAKNYALPMIMTEVTVMKNYEKGLYGLSLEQKTQPDNDHQYSLMYSPSIWSDDDISVETDSNGLLKTVTVVAEDRSGDVIRKIAELGKEVAKIMAYAFVDSTFSKYSTMVVDLTDPNGESQLNGHLNALETGLKVHVQPEEASSVSTAPVDRAACSQNICFRTLRHYWLTVTNSKGQKQAFMFVSPNRSPLSQTSITRANFVKRETTLTFENGFLAGRKDKKPSQALGFITIPVDVAKIIASIPGEIIQLKIDTTKQNAQLLGAQKDVVTSQKDLIDAQRALIKDAGTSN